jgi:hypothetical protein
MFVIIMAGYAVGIDRIFLIDQSNYLENFAEAPTLEWLNRIVQDGWNLRTLTVGLFSEEALWQVWATVLGTILSPSAAVVATVCALNLLIALSVVRLRDPAFPLLLWILLPVGFADTGLLQLRQGFALAVMLYITLRFDRPVLATLIAAMIHTTFVLAFPLVVIAWFCRRQHLLGILLAAGAAFVAAYLGGMLFETFGGRRLATYNVTDTQATSILYVFGALLCSLPSLHRLLTEEAADEPAATRGTLATLAVLHVGVCAFAIFSFFLFPLGAGRVGYLIMLLLIPILPSMRRHDSVVGMGIFATLLLYLVYLVVKTYAEGTYDVFLRG